MSIVSLFISLCKEANAPIRRGEKKVATFQSGDVREQKKGPKYFSDELRQPEEQIRQERMVRLNVILRMKTACALSK